MTDRPGRHIDFRGISIVVENERGSVRSGTDEQGRAWEHRFAAPYGRIEGTVDHDGDQVDCFIGPRRTSNKVFIIDQFNPVTKDFDEHKCFVGFDKKKQILKTYRDSYGPVYGADHTIGDITKLTLDEFKRWLAQDRSGQEPMASDVPEYQEGGAVECAPQDNEANGHFSLPADVMEKLGGGDPHVGIAVLLDSNLLCRSNGWQTRQDFIAGHHLRRGSMRSALLFRESALAVAIRGKADIAFCGAYVGL